jgi:hypothetical protein
MRRTRYPKAPWIPGCGLVSAITAAVSLGLGAHLLCGYSLEAITLAEGARPDSLRRVQDQLGTFTDLCNNRRPHRSLAHRSAPAVACTARPKATPGSQAAGPQRPGAHRLHRRRWQGHPPPRREPLPHRHRPDPRPKPRAAPCPGPAHTNPDRRKRSNPNPDVGSGCPR